MIELSPRNAAAAQPGVHPIAVAAVALALVLIGIGSIVLWRIYTGSSPETERAATTTRQLQVRTTQISEQLNEKTKGLEATQQESIDQLQAVQDQVLVLRQSLATQQAETKKLSDQVAALNEAIESLRQSFASSRAAENAEDGGGSGHSAKSKPHATRSAHRKRGRSRA
jgi:uncharacterized protein YoxC